MLRKHRETPDAPVEAHATTAPAKKGRLGLLDRLRRRLGLPVEPDDPDESRATFVRPAGTVAEDLGFELMRQDGLARIESGVYARCVRMEDVNYQGARMETQLEIHQQLLELVNEFDATARFQWFANTRLIGREEFSEEMRYKEVPGDDVLNDFRRELNTILEDTIADTSYNVKRELYLVVAVEADCMSKAAPSLDRLVSAVQRRLTDIGSANRVLDGQEWLRAVNRVTNPDDPERMVSYSDLAAHPGARSIDLVCPPFVRKERDGFQMGDYHYRCIYLSKYSNTVRDDFLSQIADLPQNMTISLHVQPLDQADSIDLVETQLLNLKQEKRNYVMQHPQTAMFDDEMLPGTLGDNITTCIQTRDDMVHGNQKHFLLTFVVMCYDKDPDVADASVEAVRQTARAFTCRFDTCSFPIEALKSCLPVANRSIPQERRISSDPLANFVPFASDELYQPGGMYIGRNLQSHRHIFCDRATMTAPNGMILGMPGRGKSFIGKGMICYTLITDRRARVLVLDPEGEFGAFCRALGSDLGEYVKISATSGNHINPLDLSLGYSSEDADTISDPLPFKVDFVISMVSQMAGAITSLEATLVDRACRAIYQRYLETGDPDDMPILEDLYNALVEQPEPQAKHLATTIERYVSGSMSVFNHRTNVDISKRLVVFDTKDLGANLSALSLLILLDQTWNIITRGRTEGKNTWFFVDELQLILDNEHARKYFDTLYSRARKWGAIPTGITQNVTRLLAVPETRLMVQNSDFLMIMGQSYNDARALAETLSLSDSQFNIIRNATVGQGLLVAEQKVVPFENIVPKELNGKPTKLYKLFTTKLSDLREMHDAA